MHFRLSLLMFLNFTVIGSWVPVLSPFLEQLDIDAHHAALVFATGALGAMFGPVLWGQIADRWLAAERCILLCCGVSGTFLWLVASSTEFAVVFCGSLGFWMFMIPSLSVGAALSFRHLANPEREYGRVRLWGTIGWIVSGLVLSGWYKIAYDGLTARVNCADALRFGAVCAWLTALYACTLPHTPPTANAAPGSSRSWLRLFDAPMSALQLFRHRSFSVLCGCLFTVYITFTLSAQLTALLVRKQGIEQGWVPSVQTLAQSTEVASLAVMSVLLVRLGQKGAMVVGLGAWCLALTAFAIGSPPVLVIASLALHGIFITCFIVAGQLYVNRLARDDMRASAQGLMTFINGVGLLIGHLLVGWLRAAVGDDYSLAFIPGAAVAGLVFVVFCAGFEASRHA